MMKFTFQKMAAIVVIFSASDFALSQNSDLESFVDGLADQYVGTNLAGMSVGIMQGEEVLLKKSYGFANLEWQVPMPMDAVHEVGSVTKQFTTASILQLYGQERLDLDADITDYLPELDTKGRNITVRQLANHTSGIKGYTEMTEFAELFTQEKPREEILRLIEKYPLDFEPGEALAYSNSGYFLMGLIIEKVSGLTYEEYLEQQLFPRAGMNGSSYCSNRNIVEGKATGYSYTDDGLVMARYHDHTWPYAAGSLCSTVSDLLAWNRAMHTGQVLSSNLYDLFISPGMLNNGFPLRYAMGVTNYTHPTGQVIEHGGGIDGFLSYSRYYPDQDVIVVVLVNTAGPIGANTLANEIGEHLFGTPFALQGQDYPGDLSQFAGEYHGMGRGTEMTITIESNSSSGSLDATIATASNSQDPIAIEYLEGNTFFSGVNYFVFGQPVSGRFSELRYDGPSSHYILENSDAP